MVSGLTVLAADTLREAVGLLNGEAPCPRAAGGSSRRPLVRFPNRTPALWVGDSPPRRGPVAV